MKPRQVICAILVFAFTATSTYGDSPCLSGRQANQHERDALGQSLLAPQSRLAATDEPENIDPAVEALRTQLRHPDRQIRQAAAVAFSKMGPRAAGAASDLIEALRDGEDAEEVRLWAILALGDIGLPAIPSLFDALRKGEILSWDAISVLSHMEPEKAAPLLREIIVEELFLRNPNKDILYAAKETLRLMDELKPPASRRGGFTSYKLPLVIVGSAVIAFALPALLPYIAAIFGAGGMLALAPIGGFDGLGEPKAESLIRALKNPKVETRIEAASRLGRIGIAAPPELRELIVSALVGALEDNDSRVRSNAAGAIGIIGFPEAPEAISALRKVLDKDPNCDVQQAARFSFQTIGLRMRSQPAIPMLLASIIDEGGELHNRQRDARLLFEVGENENVITNAALYALDVVKEPTVRGLLVRGLIRFAPDILRYKIEAFKAAKYKEGLHRIAGCLRDAAEFNKEIPDVAEKIAPLCASAEAALKELEPPIALEDEPWKLIQDLRTGLMTSKSKYNAQDAKAIRDGIDRLLPMCRQSPSVDLKVEAALLFLEAIEGYKDKLVRKDAIYAIGELAGGEIGKEVISRVPKMVPALTNVLLTDEDSGVKTKAIEALGKMELGREKAKVRVALTATLAGTYHNPRLRLAIRQALRGMDAAKPRSGAFDAGRPAASSLLAPQSRFTKASEHSANDIRTPNFGDDSDDFTLGIRTALPVPLQETPVFKELKLR